MSPLGHDPSIFVRTSPRAPQLQDERFRVVHASGAEAKGLPDAAVATRLSLPEELDKVLPALVRPDELDLEPANDNFANSDTLVTRALAELPLFVVYAVLRPGYRAWIAQTCLNDEGLDAETLHERAIANLGRTPLSEAVRHVLERRSMRVLQELDGFDAARVLLLPAYLGQDETLAALLLDRGTLALAPAPEDGDWRSLARLVRRRRTSRALFGSVIAVRPTGLAAVA